MTERQQKFVKEYMRTRKAGPSYAKAYNRPVDKTAYNNAYKLLESTGIKKSLEDIEKQLPEDAAEAYQEYVELGRSSSTPHAVKEKILNKRMALGGLLETQRTENKNEVTYKGLNDDDSWIADALKDIKARKSK